MSGLMSFLHPSVSLEPSRPLPGSPEVICEDIRSAEEDIACWERGIVRARADMELAVNAIRENTGDIARARIEIAKLRSKLAQVDRRVGDAPNVTGSEFSCRIIEPSVNLKSEPFGLHRFRVEWKHEGKLWTSDLSITPQDAWKSAFSLLDRRAKASESGGAK